MVFHFCKFGKYQVMAAKYWILFTALSLSLTAAQGQNTKADSAAVAATLKTLLEICRKVDFADPKTTTLGTFYKAAPYIVYRGADKKRAWKDVANYNKPDEKAGVDETCLRINETVNRDTAWTITGYFTEKESEGTWYVLKVRYTKKGVAREAAFAFLKIGNRYGLGDID